MSRGEFVSLYLSANQETKDLIEAVLELDQDIQKRVVPLLVEWLKEDNKSLAELEKKIKAVL